MSRTSPAEPGDSILVTAPEQGSPSFVVNLPAQSISASANIAISSRRSIRVVPVPDAYPYRRLERVTIGKVVSHGEPYYSSEAKRMGIEGTVELKSNIGPGGEIASIKAVSGPPLLVAAAISAMRDWRYEPTLIDGTPIPVQADVTMVFRLR
jgi:TonB family protein